MQIALDAMGGDKAPRVIVEGVVEAIQRSNADLEILLVGRKDVLSKELERFPKYKAISIWPASEVIEMSESPAVALRKKRDASVVVATKLHKEGKADAVISAGNTGAAMASSLWELGSIKGVARPAIATTLPAESGRSCTILDVGANTHSKPEHLYQFGIMGSLYVSHIFGISNPKVGLLSIGEEKSKGNSLIVETHELLAKSDLNFIGNVEGFDILRGTADVVVCDGFVGNILLKFAESMFGMFFKSFREKVKMSLKRKIGAFLLKSTFNSIRKEMDYQEYGGAPLLGINGVTVICHGSSSPTAIKNAIRVCQKLITEKVNDHIKEQFQKDGKET